MIVMPGTTVVSVIVVPCCDCVSEVPSFTTAGNSLEALGEDSLTESVAPLC
jgi:hypothetical protein